MSSHHGHEIARPRLLNQQRPSKYAKKPKKERARDRREGMSEAHLAAVRKLWCVITSERRIVECHHLRSGPAKAERGLGLKCTDKWVLPVSRITHNHIEGLGSRNEFQFFDDHGINPYELADALWQATPDVERMAKVLEAHQDQARLIVAQRTGRGNFKKSVAGAR